MKPSALSAIFSSRKGIAAVITTIFVLVMFVAECVAAALGKMTFAEVKSDGTTQAALLAGIWGVFILGTAHEDAAKKSAGGPTPSDPGTP